MRSASSSVTRGSTCNCSVLPFTLRVIGTAPGPTALTVCALAPGAFVSTPAATPLAPTVLRKLRRLNPGSSLRLGMSEPRAGTNLTPDHTEPGRAEDREDDQLGLT